MKYYFYRSYRWLFVLALLIMPEVLSVTCLHHVQPTHRGSGMPLTAIPSPKDGNSTLYMEKDCSVLLSSGNPAQPAGPEDENGLNTKAVTLIIL